MLDWFVCVTCQRKWCWFFSLDLVVQVRQLPVGDGIWIARHKEDHTEYVLDFIVERKEVMDLDGSIEDNRYKDQKFRMQVPSELAFASAVVITYKPWTFTSFSLFVRSADDTYTIIISFLFFYLYFLLSVGVSCWVLSLDYPNFRGTERLCCCCSVYWWITYAAIRLMCKIICVWCHDLMC